MFEFVVFAGVLLGIALWHRFALWWAVAGVVVLLSWQLLGQGVVGPHGSAGLFSHLRHEWVLLGNLLALLTGFALLARHFELSGLPQWLPGWLPDRWTGGLMLLVWVFVLSAFLDNIAAAMIGGTVARVVFRERVHTGFVAALVAAANAGGSGSVVGDTTTTMLWLSGVAPGEVLHAYVPALLSLCIFGVCAARMQHAYAPITREADTSVKIDSARLWVCVLTLAAAVFTNVLVSLHWPAAGDHWPWIGSAVWLALLLLSGWRQPDWSLLPGALRGAAFLLCLVLMASLLPVTRLPPPTALSTAALGVVSAVFDNIPLTRLAIEQGGYDWGLLAYAVGFGGSMLWFGSSAGVAICGQFPQARTVDLWLRHGWPVVVAYGVSVAVYLCLWSYLK